VFGKFVGRPEDIQAALAARGERALSLVMPLVKVKSRSHGDSRRLLKGLARVTVARQVPW
jgi:hypothetical protein